MIHKISIFIFGAIKSKPAASGICLYSLPNSVVDASTINTLKVQLDKLWMHQAVKYDFTADMTGTGNRSVTK